MGTGVKGLIRSCITSLIFLLAHSTVSFGAWTITDTGYVGGFNGIWGSSATDVFAVGYRPTGFPHYNILHYNGSAWRLMNQDINANIGVEAIWGSSGSDVFTVGYEGKISHYDGRIWSSMDSGTTENLLGVWGSSESDVFAVGNNGAIVHFDGSSWAPMTSGTTELLKAVWGSSDSDVFAVGLNGTILHYDGVSWSAMNSRTSWDLLDIWGFSGSDVFVVRDFGAILHYNGAGWSERSIGITGLKLYSIWGRSRNDIYGVGPDGVAAHYNGSGWRRLTTNATIALYDVWGSQTNEVFAVGNRGEILHLVPEIEIVLNGRDYTAEAGYKTYIDVRLSTKPSSDVTIPVASSDTTEGVVNKSDLNFTTSNYFATQTVTVTGVDDDENDGDMAYRIMFGPSISTDDEYNGTIGMVDLENWDYSGELPPVDNPPTKEWDLFDFPGGCFVGLLTH